MAQQITRRDICRLLFDERVKHSNRQIGRLAGVSATTVGKYRTMLAIHGIRSRKDLEALGASELDQVLQTKKDGAKKDFEEPDWGTVHHDYQKRGCTIALLYTEYMEDTTPGPGKVLMSEATYGRKLRAYAKKHKLSMRQEHAPGECMFVDFSGGRLAYQDAKTGESIPVEVFVACWGASKLIFATAVPTQQLADWIEANVRALEYAGGVTATIMSDNLKSAVIKPAVRGRDPVINRSYQAFADHYGTVIVPARVRKPQDKSLAEGAVKIVKNWLLKKLRNHTFFSIHEINEAIAPLLERINERTTRGLQQRSRWEIFKTIERQALKSLPAVRHEFAEWTCGVRVPHDYHISIKGDFYSVPHCFVSRTVNYSVSRTMVKIYCESDVVPVAVHDLRNGSGQSVTNKEHMPQKHRVYAESNVSDFLAWAQTQGADVETAFRAILGNPRIHAIHALRHLGKLQKAASQYGTDRLQCACKIANEARIQTADSIINILDKEIDRRRRNANDTVATVAVQHENVRGAAAYGGE